MPYVPRHAGGPGDQHAQASKSVRFPAAPEGPSLLAWYAAHWKPAGLRSMNAGLVEALRAYATARGWESPREAAEVDAALAAHGAVRGEGAREAAPAALPQRRRSA